MRQGLSDKLILVEDFLWGWGGHSVASGSKLQSENTFQTMQRSLLVAPGTFMPPNNWYTPKSFHPGPKAECLEIWNK